MTTPRKSPHALIMAGGTGGHVFPALAVAEALRQRDWQVSWLGTAQGIEARLVPERDIVLHTLPVAGWRGKRFLSRLAAPWRLSASLWAALALMLRVRPQVVLGFGGFASGPGGLMAAALGRPLLIHEQNAVAGMTNRWLARVADQVLAGFPDSFPENVAVSTVGNPVRRAIAEVPAPEQRWLGRDGPLRLLVLGGSLGALRLNQIVPEALALLPAAPLVRHQTGTRTLEAAQTQYAQAGVDAEILPFIEDMAAAYAWADVVVCRAGALTVAEIAAAGVPALFVPYPHAVDDHQTANARELVQAGAAWLLPETELTAEGLAARLGALTREDCLERGRQARLHARIDATDRLVAACESALPKAWHNGRRRA